MTNLRERSQNLQHEMTSKRKQIDSLSTQLAGLARNQAVLQTKNSDLNDKLKGFVNAMANLKAACNGRC